MSSFYDDASLVVIPSGYKTSKVYAEKPTDGSGDLAFTRTGDTATRVNSAGLIEKVRTNYARQSQAFATAAVWTATNGTLTNNAGTAPDGTNTASKIVATNTDPFCYQSITLTGPVVASCYVKAVGSAIGKSAEIRAGVSLTSFTLSGSWQRVSVTHTASGAHNYGLEVPNPGVIGDEVLLWGFQVEGGDVATSYIPTLTAAVSTGPTANVPRLDYLGSTCPRLLLEPQRTNLALYSEQFNNASWTKGAQLSVTANSGTSPDGTASADLIYANANSSNCVIFNGVTTTVSTVYTSSLFVKASGKSWVFIRGINDGVGAYFNVSTGALGTVQAGVTATITNYGNGWYRCTVTQTASFTTGRLVVLTVDNNGSTSVTASGTDGLLIWGAQLEAGAYATSYIPTLAASATRGADACSKTGISSLIGQTEGTIFIDFKLNQAPSDANGRLLQLWATNDTTNAIIPIVNQSLQLQITTFGASAGSAIITAGPSTLLGLGQNKIAVAYTSTSVVVYRNGVLFASGNPTGFFPTSLTSLDLGGSSFATRNLGNPINQALLFPTRLSNAALAELTTL